MPESAPRSSGARSPGRSRPAKRRDRMKGPLNPKFQPSAATRRTAIGLILGAPLLGACASVQQSLSQFSNPFSSSEGPAGPPQDAVAVGTGQFKVGLVLPLSGAGNAGV